VLTVLHDDARRDAEEGLHERDALRQRERRRGRRHGAGGRVWRLSVRRRKRRGAARQFFAFSQGFPQTGSLSGFFVQSRPGLLGGGATILERAQASLFFEPSALSPSFFPSDKARRQR
jgi:hypothetical protein